MGNDSIGPRGDRAHVGIVAHADADHVGAARHLRAGVGDPRAAFGQRRPGLGADVEHDGLESAGDEPLRHRLADVAEPNEPYAHRHRRPSPAAAAARR